MKQHYTTLGVSEKASPDEIKSAYRKMAVLHHPDKGGTEQKFKEINEANEVLSNPKKRQEYDLGERVNQFTGFNRPTGGMHGFSSFFMDPFFSHREQPKPTVAIEIISKLINITLKESFSGVKRHISIDRMIKCTCVKDCEECNGRGFVQKTSVQQLNNARFVQSYQQECAMCKGSGQKLLVSDCKICGKSCKIKSSVSLQIDIPPKTFHDFTTTIKHPEHNSNCQIKFTVCVKFQDGFTKSNNDLVYVIKPTLAEVLLGACYKIEHPSGEILEIDYISKLEIVNNNTILTINDKGILPNSNLIVKFQIEYPSKRLENVSEMTYASFKDNMKAIFNI